MIRSVCVYCSSSSAVAPVYHAAAAELGQCLARRGVTLVFGGTNAGLMGELARSTQAGGGRVIGVIPGFIRDQGIGFEQADELVVTSDLRERKAVMESRADAFLALPGGFGTLEEILEVLTLKQLRTHAKPVAILNSNGFYDPLLAQFDRIFAGRFSKEEFRQAFVVTRTPLEALEALEHPPVLDGASKWFSPSLVESPVSVPARLPPPNAPGAAR